MNNKLVSHYRLADYEYGHDLDSRSAPMVRLAPRAYCDSEECHSRGGEAVRNLGLRKNVKNSVDWCFDCGHALIWKA